MAKLKSAFVCQNCGAQSAKWIGRCPSCGEWNTYVEEVVQSFAANKSSALKIPSSHPARLLDEIQPLEQERILTPDSELNRVLGGGIVPGSLILIGGEPGIGKSTLMLQMALQFKNQKIVYISGEESEQQIKLRADRMISHNKECYLLTEVNLELIINQLQQLQPHIIIVDSIHTLATDQIEATPGSIPQIRTCASELQRYAKENGIPVFLIGHITKEGIIAGPKLLEHMVDTVLQFEGDRHNVFRILRALKNRFGPTFELAVYEMQGQGLRPITNLSEILLTQRDEILSGITIASIIEGVRPMMIETQALVTNTQYGTPQRTATGFDLRRLQMLLAVLEKRCGIVFGNRDVFLNIAGGLQVEDTAADLAIIAALVSSWQDIPIADRVCFCGEIGLSGEVRAVSRIEQRIGEADRLGFEKIFISKYNKKGLDLKKYKLEIKTISKVDELIRQLNA